MITLIKILITIIIIVIIYFLINYFQKDYKENYNKCDLDNLNIDDVVVIKRTPAYSNLINDIIDKKNFIFNEQQIKVLKNPQQIFTVKNNLNDIKNISDLIYTNCKGKLDNDINGTLNDDIINYSDKNYDLISKELINDIEKTIEPNFFNTGVLRNNIPFSKNYLKNYYKDIYGNRVKSDLSDYFTAYYTLINEDNNIGFPVNTEIGKSNFLIPDQYNTDKHFSNAYNIDWDRIINPISYSQ